MELTQEFFGHALGVSRNYIYYLERGERKPNKTLRLLLDCIEEHGVYFRAKEKEVKR